MAKKPLVHATYWSYIKEVSAPGTTENTPRGTTTCTLRVANLRLGRSSDKPLE